VSSVCHLCVNISSGTTDSGSSVCHLCVHISSGLPSLSQYRLWNPHRLPLMDTEAYFQKGRSVKLKFSGNNIEMYAHNLLQKTTI
jgi:hypothetical protein